MTWGFQGPRFEGSHSMYIEQGFLASGAFQSPGRNRYCVMWITVSFGNTIFQLFLFTTIPSWIVTKAWSWDALPLLGYGAEEHQLSATNPLNSLDKFHGQFLVFGTVVTSVKAFMCRQWKAVTSYEQTSLLGNITVGWLTWGRALGPRPYFSHLSFRLGSFWIKLGAIGTIANKPF